ncbi:hypothetical protein Tco_0616339 [Tanacetum coccineum]
MRGVLYPNLSFSILLLASILALVLWYRKDGDGDGYSQPHKGVKASANSDVKYSFTSAQDGNPLQDDVRLCLGDDLKKAQDHCQRQANTQFLIVKNLEKKNRSRTHRLKRLYKVGLTTRVKSSDNEETLGEDASKQERIDVIDADEEITLVSIHDVNVSAGEEVFATTVEDITLA